MDSAAESATHSPVDSAADRADLRAAALTVLRAALDDSGLDWEQPDQYTLVAALPGTRKLSTTCSLRVGEHTLSVNAFVVRRPDENHEGFYRWLLERNTRVYGLAYAIDRLGDVYLVGRLPLAAVTAPEVDRLLGSVLTNADEPFNTLLELGFASAIKREWQWRVSRGESTRNLEAFARLTGAAEPSGPDGGAAGARRAEPPLPGRPLGRPLRWRPGRPPVRTRRGSRRPACRRRTAGRRRSG
ncbi:YbjN domain-containing protein [Streptacidiphilus sp. 4-A2]|nr:YbjN domain-containing protein [Streptacidiphilus sp. 4-A2]